MAFNGQGNTTLTTVLAVGFGLVALYFIHRSFYGMRIGESIKSVAVAQPKESTPV